MILPLSEKTDVPGSNTGATPTSGVRRRHYRRVCAKPVPPRAIFGVNPN
jgi:hypothetical protein